jgi:hypothetical protein
MISAAAEPEAALSARRSLRGRAAAAIAIVAIAGGIGVTQLRPATNGTLEINGMTDVCWQASSPADWREKSANGKIFGATGLRLSRMDAEVVVLSVTMTRSTGGLVLDHVAFVPFGGVAEGSDGTKAIDSSVPQAVPLARKLPAVLNRMPRPAGVVEPYKSSWDPREWELAATVHAPATSTRASLNGFTIKYLTGGVLRTLHTDDSITLGNQDRSCRF